jgi:SAM-dependent methyltransferase
VNALARDPRNPDEASEYDRYVREEWTLFDHDGSRGAAARSAAAGLAIRRVLDVGCGAGQEMRPFVAGVPVIGVGLDRSAEAGRAGRALFAQHEPGARVVFARGAAEQLPFLAACFDLVICRLALPYTDNDRALAEISRVLRPGGALILKIHHARYYVAELLESLSKRRLLTAIHASRVLAAGAVYYATGVQPRNRLVGEETFQTRRMLARLVGAHGLRIERELDAAPRTPAFLIRRAGV